MSGTKALHTVIPEGKSIKNTVISKVLTLRAKAWNYKSHNTADLLTFLANRNDCIYCWRRFVYWGHFIVTRTFFFHLLHIFYTRKLKKECAIFCSNISLSYRILTIDIVQYRQQEFGDTKRKEREKRAENKSFVMDSCMFALWNSASFVLNPKTWDLNPKA